jgi:DNA replication protein DnaC
MTIDLTDAQFDALLKRLHLANARRSWRDLVQQAEREEWTYRDFLALLVAEETAQRQQTRVARMVRRARFPFLKTIDDFNFTYQSTVRLSLLGSALAPDFITEGRCLILGGKPGRGPPQLRHRYHRPEFPESTGQIFRNQKPMTPELLTWSAESKENS